MRGRRIACAGWDGPCPDDHKGPHPACTRCFSLDTRRVRNYGRPVANEWSCYACGRRFDLDTAETDAFYGVFNRLEHHIEQRYGIPVVITQIPSPFTGDLDGARILLDFHLTPEDATFTVAHLFGHTVQWNVSPRARELGTLSPVGPSQELLEELATYEREAARYSLALLRHAGAAHLDQVALGLCGV